MFLLNMSIMLSNLSVFMSIRQCLCLQRSLIPCARKSSKSNRNPPEIHVQHTLPPPYPAVDAPLWDVIHFRLHANSIGFGKISCIRIHVFLCKIKFGSDQLADMWTNVFVRFWCICSE